MNLEAENQIMGHYLAVIHQMLMKGRAGEGAEPEPHSVAARGR